MATTETPAQHTKVLIVGSGPAGYTAAIYAARAGFAPIVIAGSLTAGGALMNTTEVENYPGFPEGILGPDLMAKMQEQAEKFGTEVVWDDVETFDLTANPKSVTTALGETYTGDAVILATGSEYRKLGVPGERELSGRGVSYCATCDGFFFKDQHVIVVGGGDSAMEEANFLSRFASQVTVVHRRDALRASAIMAQRAHDNPKIDFLWNSAIESINDDATTGKMKSATIRNLSSGETSEIPATGLFVAIGHEPRSKGFASQINLDENGYILVDGRSTRTNIPGVFACGDVVDHTYQQAITAAGSGCAAALDAQHYLEEFRSA
jgi:thioredoxin reductase (NADPH)